MNRGLAEAVVDALRSEPADVLRQRFEAFHEQDWSRSSNWLHTSGLALYFLSRVRELGIVEVLPPRVLRELEDAHSENRARTEAMFDEFVRVNMAFQRATLSYANLKGFSLAPRACPDPSYRYQHDLDFLVSPRDAERCRQVVVSLGYRLKREYDGSWEFVAGTPEVLSMRDLYRMRSERTLEIHFVSAREQDESGSYGDRLLRLQLQVWNGFEFPALSECDKLLGQAQHLFRHLQSEWTRAAWMLEFTTAIRSHEGNTAFWVDTVTLLREMPQRMVGTGFASLIATRAFGATLPDPYFAATVGQLPRHVRLWADRYQEDVVFAKHPGSKLYLLLQDVLSQDCARSRTQRRKKLFPVHLPPRVPSAQEGNTRMRLKGVFAQMRFTLERLRFHVTSGFRYKIESARWKKLVAHPMGRLR
jgi:Uncharacterised nucleotidyltransferase